jgi:hypothetical protein
MGGQYLTVLKKAGYEFKEWTHQVLYRIKWQTLLNTALNLQSPEKEQNFLTILTTISFSNKLCSTDLVNKMHL